jgi:hypothetical protein
LKTTKDWCTVEPTYKEGTPLAVLDEPVFEEPKLTPKQGKYERVLDPLQETPNKWAKIGEYKTEDSAYQAALNLRHGKYKIPGTKDDWEFVSDGLNVHARFINPSSNGPAKKATKKVAKKA